MSANSAKINRAAIALQKMLEDTDDLDASLAALAALVEQMEKHFTMHVSLRTLGTAMLAAITMGRPGYLKRVVAATEMPLVCEALMRDGGFGTAYSDTLAAQEPRGTHSMNFERLKGTLQFPDEAPLEVSVTFTGALVEVSLGMEELVGIGGARRFWVSDKKGRRYNFVCVTDPEALLEDDWVAYRDLEGRGYAHELHEDAVETPSFKLREY